jgi:hypothetical protein
MGLDAILALGCVSAAGGAVCGIQLGQQIMVIRSWEVRQVEPTARLHQASLPLADHSPMLHAGLPTTVSDIFSRQVRPCVDTSWMCKTALIL